MSFPRYSQELEDRLERAAREATLPTATSQELTISDHVRAINKRGDFVELYPPPANPELDGSFSVAELRAIADEVERQQATATSQDQEKRGMTREQAMDVLLDGLTDDEFREIERRHSESRHRRIVAECADALRGSRPIPFGTNYFDASNAALRVAIETGRAVSWEFNSCRYTTHPTETPQEP